MSFEEERDGFLAGKVLLFDKPLNWTSFNLVKKVKNLIRNRFNIQKIKVGHAGTLDPLATGLLLVCTGKATKTIQQLQEMEKEYIATIHLGKTTGFPWPPACHSPDLPGHSVLPSLRIAARGPDD